MGMSEGIELEVYKYNNPLGSTPDWILPGRKAPKYLEELKGSGGGSFFLPRTNPTYVADPEVLDSRNLCRLKVDGTVVGAFILGARSSRILSEGGYRDHGFDISGEGLKTWFDDASIFPSEGLATESAKNRHFNFATERGTWYNPSDWITPFDLGPVLGPTRWAEAPNKWPEDAKSARWVWGSAYSSTMPTEPCYFRWEVTITTPGAHALYVAADDAFILYVDGAKVASGKGWEEASRIEVPLSAGDHVIAFVANNELLEEGTPRGPAGLAAALTRVQADKEVMVGVSGTTDWKVFPYPTSIPGWPVGEILLKLLDEAEGRGVMFPQWITPTFTDTHDSYGNPWTDLAEWSFSVGQSLKEVVDSLEEFYDIWIDPLTLELHVVPTRGEVRDLDHDDPVTFLIGKHLREASTQAKGKIKNVLAISTNDGWAQEEESTSVSKYGRLEGSMSVNASKQTAASVADVVFSHRAQEEEGASYALLSLEYQPFVDFGVGDWVYAPNDREMLVLRRVMSISVEESDAGLPVYTIEFDTIFQDNDARMSKALTKLGGGGVSGSSSSGMGITPGGGEGVIVLPPTNTPRVMIPKPPTGLDVVSTGYWGSNGTTPLSEVTVTWNPVTQNVDDSPTIPVRYELEGRDTSLPGTSFEFMGATSGTTLDLVGFIALTEWEFQVRAVNNGNGYSAYSTTTTELMVGPTAPLPSPSTPTMHSELGVMVASWDGLLGGDPPPPHFRYVYAEISTNGTSGWVSKGPSLTRDGRQVSIPGEPIGSTRWARFIAVDGLGIESTPSSAASITITGITIPDLDSAITDVIDQASSDASGAAILAADAHNEAVAAKNEVGNAIATSLDEYVVTSSATTPPPPGAPWDADTPDWEPGEFVWRRTKNTHINGTVSYGAPVVITGADGSPGEDAVLLRVSSSRGTSFKNNTISTVLTVTVFKGAEQITDIADLHATFGSGAYLEWWWRRMDDTDFGVISSADSRLSQAGFALTVSPADVDEQTVFQCILHT